MSRQLIEVVRCDRCGNKEQTNERVAGSPDDVRRIDISDDCFGLASAPELFAIAMRVGVPIGVVKGSKPTETKFPCKYCTHSSTSKQGLYTHIREQHQDVLPHSCEEPGCDRRFDSTSGRARHYTRTGHGPPAETTTDAEEQP